MTQKSGKLTNIISKMSLRNQTFNIQKVWSISHDKIYIIFELGQETNYKTSTKEKNNIYKFNITDFNFTNQDNLKRTTSNLNHIIESKKSYIIISANESRSAEYLERLKIFYVIVIVFQIKLYMNLNYIINFCSNYCPLIIY